MRRFARALGLGAFVLGCALHTPWAFAQDVDFGQAPASSDARQVRNWVVQVRDNAGLPFAIVDKVESRVHVFDGAGSLLGTAPALVGLTAGDTSVPGIGERKLSTITPAERTTPAGRFVASLARGMKGEEILWVDYESAVALHRVAVGAPKERRLQRLASHLASERRITYGCINVSVAFFEKVVLAAFKAGTGIVYVLPESSTLREVFVSFEAPESAR